MIMVAMDETVDGDVHPYEKELKVKKCLYVIVFPSPMIALCGFDSCLQ